MTAKSTTARPRKTAVQRQAEAKALHEKLTTQIEALASSGEWQKFLDYAASFHSYSLNNLLLITAQCPHATQVAGFRAWQVKGRQVRKGEKSIKIFGYSSKKITEKNEKTGEDEEKKITLFPILSVFDISQTDPIEGVATPAHPSRRLEGTDDADLYARTAAYLEGIGWTVTREPIPGEANGYTTTDGTRRVVVEANVSDAQAAKTAIHEAAHVLLHADEDHAEYIAHRGIKETEAESVAYIVAGVFGLDTAAYSVGYVAGWSKTDPETIKATAANVLRTAHTLTEALDPTEDNDGDEDTEPTA
ncbi:ArdC-like ssDNA-binding domain-containing protein [Kocuria turfanensis]|uniref:ArdC-like ssDNA-binding domain-containing protein n=1 Tax=Kocuria turfanensis TaxID=388357 RepID=UPI004036B003